MELDTVWIQHRTSSEHRILINRSDLLETDTIIDLSEPAGDLPDREVQLKAMRWQEIKALAESLGLAKADDQSWHDLIPEIIKEENVSKGGS